MNRTIKASFVRPADTAVYASGDVINDSTSAGTVLSFSRALGIRGNNALLVSALLIDAAAQATKLASELWLFTAAPGADNDNTPFTPTAVELESMIAIIAFTTPHVADATAGATGTVVFPATDMAKVFRAGGASSDLYGVLVARIAYTPVSAERFTIVLGIQE